MLHRLVEPTGYSRHGRTRCWPAPVAIDHPRQTVDQPFNPPSADPAAVCWSNFLERCILIIGGAMRRREFIALLAGASVVAPMGARGQQQAVPVIGYLSSSRADTVSQIVDGFVRDLPPAGA